MISLVMYCCAAAAVYTHASIIDSQFLRYFTVIVEGLVDNIGSNKYKVAPTKPIQGQTIY